MKKLSAIVLVALIAFASTAAAEGLILSVRPGTLVQSGQIGYRSGQMAGFLGVDFLSVSAEATAEQSESYTTSGTPPITRRNVIEYELEGSARLAVVNLGGQYYFGPMGTMQKYVFASVFKSLPSVSGKITMTDTSYEDGTQTDRDQQELELESEEEDLIKDLLGFKGFTLGLGGEYFFDPAFSVSGEYGLRWISFSTEYDKTTPDPDNFYDDYVESYKADASAKLKMTYGVVALNYHFGEADE